MNEIVVIGSGQAAIQAVMSLKRNEFTGSIKVIGEEDHLPYQRPPLSKDFLLEEYKPERVSLKKKEFYNKDDMKRLKIAENVTGKKFKKNSFIYSFMSSLRQKINDPLGVRATKRKEISQR